MQKQTKKMSVPEELKHPFFFFENEVLAVIEDGKVALSENFIYEILYFGGHVALRPWEQPEGIFPIVIKQWEDLKIQLEQLHSTRDSSSVLEYMKKGIGLFLQLLFWSNEEPVNLQKLETVENFVYKPVNSMERVSFLLSRPKLYHSFIQLGELFKEQEKQFVIKAIKKNASRK